MLLEKNKIEDELKRINNNTNELEELNKQLNTKLNNRDKENNTRIKEIENQKNVIKKELIEKEKINENNKNIQIEYDSLNKK